VITNSCLSLNGISCRACEDACDPRAIRFRLMTGGRATPVLDEALCTGCGECAYTCPAGAVAFEKAEPITMEAAT
jgi:ferredoxin-type protein NapF